MSPINRNKYRFFFTNQYEMKERYTEWFYNFLSSQDWHLSNLCVLRQNLCIIDTGLTSEWITDNVIKTGVSLAPKKSPLNSPLLKSWSHFPMTPFLPSSIWDAYRISPCIIRTFLPRNLHWEVGAYYATEHKIFKFLPPNIADALLAWNLMTKGTGLQKHEHSLEIKTNCYFWNISQLHLLCLLD